MAFVQKTWQNDKAGGTQITADELNRVEQGVADAHSGTAAASTVVTTADAVTSLDAAVLNARTADLLIDYTRDAPGGSWRRKDGALVVPQWYSDPTDPGKLARSLKAFADASAAYTRTRTTYTPTTTLAGIPALAQGVGPELYFTPDQEWHLGADSLYNVGLRRKRVAFMLTPALQRLHGDRTTIVRHDTTGANCALGTRYRPWVDDPIRSNGDASVWDMTANGEHDFYSGGRGSGGRIEWRYTKTAQAVISADVSRGSQTVTVDNVDGIDRAWFAAHGLSIPSTLTDAALKVGSFVFVSCGMNLNDAHEHRDFMICHIVAINGSTTPGFTATGAGTITLSQPFPVDMTLSQQFWNYDGTGNSHFVYTPSGSGGTENTDSHSIWSIDPTLLCLHAHVGDFDFIMDPSSATAPTSYISFQGCIDPSFGHVRAFNNGLQVIDFTAVKGGYGRIVEALGTNPGLGIGGAGSQANSGMAMDADTAQVRVDEIRSVNYLGAVAQAESYSRVEVGRATLLDTHPWRVAESGTNAQINKGAFLVIGGSEMTVDAVDWTTTSGRLAFVTTPEGSDFKVRERLNVTLLNATKRPTITGGTLGAQCRIRYDGYKTDGSAPATYKLDTARSQTPVVASYAKSTTVTETLPAGLIADGRITLPADTTGLTALKLTNPGLVGGFAAVNLLTGLTLTDVTGTATDSVGDGLGSDLDRTVTSAGGGFVGTSAGDTFIWNGGNTDGTAYTSTVIDATNAPNSVILGALLPRTLTAGTTIRVGDIAVPGQTVKLPLGGTSFTSRFGTVQSFNLGKLEKEAAGSVCYLSATFDGTADDASGKAIILDLDVYPPRLDPSAQASLTRSRTAVTGGRGTNGLASLLTALRPYVSDQTTGVGETQLAIRTTDSAAVNNTGALVTSTVLVANLVANATYRFRANIFYDATATADLKMGWSVPSGATGKWVANGYLNSVAGGATGGTTVRGQTDIGSTANVGAVGAGTIAATEPYGIVQTGSTAGQLAFRYAQQNAEVSDLFIRALSTLEVVRIA